MTKDGRWFTPDGREIRCEYESTPALWFAYLPDEYDGAPDAGRQLTGMGKTEREAIDDLLVNLEEWDA